MREREREPTKVTRYYTRPAGGAVKASLFSHRKTAKQRIRAAAGEQQNRPLVFAEASGKRFVSVSLLPVVEINVGHVQEVGVSV